MFPLPDHSAAMAVEIPLINMLVGTWLCAHGQHITAELLSLISLAGRKRKHLSAV